MAPLKLAAVPSLLMRAPPEEMPEPLIVNASVPIACPNKSSAAPGETVVPAFWCLSRCGLPLNF
jgi:hypothetical protein